MTKYFKAKWFNSALNMEQEEQVTEDRLRQLKTMPFVHGLVFEED